jgi:UDP-2-acetamido-3-amino-2,3-dideoxy-glucuronate N-acetyltransferase
MSYYKHETAILDAGASIGSGTKIWHWVHVSGKAKVGRDCVLGQNVYVGNDVVIGDRVKIQNNVSVYDSVTLEDEVFCGPSAVFTNVINPRAAIERKHEFKPTLVRKGATLGANCTVLCGVTIGRYAFIAAGAVVTKDVPDYALVVGVPGRQSGWMSEHGDRLIKTDKKLEWKCPSTGETYSETPTGMIRAT